MVSGRREFGCEKRSGSRHDRTHAAGRWAGVAVRLSKVTGAPSSSANESGRSWTRDSSARERVKRWKEALSPRPRWWLAVAALTANGAAALSGQGWTRE